jgi:hypothetical protein
MDCQEVHCTVIARCKVELVSYSLMGSNTIEVQLCDDHAEQFYSFPSAGRLVEYLMSVEESLDANNAVQGS